MGTRRSIPEEISTPLHKDRTVVKCRVLSLEDKAHLTGKDYNTLYLGSLYSQPLVSEWQWLLGDSDHSALSCDFEEEWMVNERNDVDEASSVSVDERNSLPLEKDSNSLLSDRTIQIDGSPNMVGDAIHFNTKNPCEPSELETPDNHNVAKELNADFIEENISTNIGVWRDRMWPDGWTAVTADGKRSARFEHTLLTGVEVLTARLPTSPKVFPWLDKCIFPVFLQRLN
ncbi:methionine aminopeptidase 1A [Tanacetum coccineum]